MSVSRLFGIGLAAALTLGAAGPSSASPISGGAALKQAVPGGATDVRWRGGWFPGTVAAGVIGGAALAGAYPYYGYPRYAYYHGPYYGPGPYWGWRHRYWRRHHWRRW
jgi:hypothetical protein